MSDFDHWVAHLKSPRVHHVLDIHASILDTAFLYAQSVIISNGVCSSQGNDIYFKLQRSENDTIVILCSFLTQGRGTNFLVDNLFLTPTRSADVWPLVFNTSSLAAIMDHLAKDVMHPRFLREKRYLKFMRETLQANILTSLKACHKSCVFALANSNLLR